MADEQNLNENQMDLLKKLAAIGSDLWGGMPSAAYEKEEVPDKQKGTAPAQAPAKKKENGIHQLWKTADETVDWTDALAHDAPTDGLTGRRLWSFYHRMAEKVLSGDLEAYTEVLKTSNPLGELTAFAEGISMRAPDAERVEAQFNCRAEFMEDDAKQYLCAMGVRIARDLLACLPVSEVGVTAVQDGKTVMEATYRRENMLHRNFSFLDPVKLTEECGGTFGL